MAFARCPKCGSKSIRTSRVRGFAERILSVLGVCPFRCRNCSHRFTAAVWDVATVRYARCPKCLRTELSTWSQQYYNPPWTTRFILGIGATPYRCEFCRCNFASFRACKERFSWRRRRAQIAAPAASQEDDQAQAREAGG